MIDYLLQFTDEASAIADPVVGAYHFPATERGPASWRGDCVIPAAQVWHPSEDVHTQVPGPGGGMVDVVTHNFLPGFYLVISKVVQDAPLDNHKSTEFVLLRDEGQQFVDFTGSIAGRTLTVADPATNPIVGTIASGMTISGTNIRAGTKITSGSGLSWQVDLNQNVAQTAIHGQQTYIISTTYSAADLQDLMIQPMYLGSNYPYQRTYGKWV